MISDASISANIVLIGQRLSALEADIGSLVPELVAVAIAKTGVDFRSKGYRVTPEKTPANTSLPSGSYLQAPSTIRFNTGAVVNFDGWDFTEYVLYCDRGNVSFVDCTISNSKTTALDVRGDANVYVQWCLIDGQRSTINNQSNVAQYSDTSRLTILDTQLRGSSVDFVTFANGFIFERNWVYDSGYQADEFYHVDLMQLLVGGGVKSGISIRNNLLTCGGARSTNNAIRIVTVNGASIDGAVIDNNIIAQELSNTFNAPIHIGAQSSGGSIANVTIKNNFLRYGTSRPDYPEPAPSGAAVWLNNINFDTGGVISPPSGWSS